MIDALAVRSDLMFLFPRTPDHKIDLVVNDVIKEAARNSGKFVRFIGLALASLLLIALPGGAAETSLHIDMEPGVTKVQWDLIDNTEVVCCIEFGRVEFGLYYVVRKDNDNPEPK